jgi:hypothetical protein
LAGKLPSALFAVVIDLKFIVFPPHDVMLEILGYFLVWRKTQHLQFISAFDATCPINCASFCVCRYLI